MTKCPICYNEYASWRSHCYACGCVPRINAEQSAAINPDGTYHCVAAAKGAERTKQNLTYGASMFRGLCDCDS